MESSTVTPVSAASSLPGSAAKKMSSGELQVRIMLKLTLAFVLGIAGYALLAEMPAIRGSAMLLYTGVVLWVMIKG
ncbi:MAG: hypothetical protein VKJ06_06900 [Vampirovibrionales bacterium]|nr:hypothetical protein [Vampirovibrionales bacterium]